MISLAIIDVLNIIPYMDYSKNYMHNSWKSCDNQRWHFIFTKIFFPWGWGWGEGGGRGIELAGLKIELGGVKKKKFAMYRS